VREVRRFAALVARERGRVVDVAADRDAGATKVVAGAVVVRGGVRTVTTGAARRLPVGAGSGAGLCDDPLGAASGPDCA
jgi:hypothetical protein